MLHVETRRLLRRPFYRDVSHLRLSDVSRLYPAEVLTVLV